MGEAPNNDQHSPIGKTSH